jgi:hypothetical protein
MSGVLHVSTSEVIQVNINCRLFPTRVLYLISFSIQFIDFALSFFKMATHTAVVTASIHGPLETIQVPTITPSSGEVRVRVEWTASTPLDLHQNDGGLLVTHPQVLGDGTAGTVVEVGPDVKRLTVGDKVFGFTWRNQKEKSHQEFVTCPEFLLGIVGYC